MDVNTTVDQMSALAIVTMGNIVGGGLLVGGSYCFAARQRMGVERHV